MEIQPLLIFDTTAILAAKPSQWQEWDRFGQCVLPQAVYTELEYLTQRASEPQQETTAREFMRFHPGSGFQISDASAFVIKANPDGQSLSKRARLEQTIAECTYALAKQQVGTLVILVSNDRPLLLRVVGLGIPNLGSISVAELLQWIRQKQRPNGVEQTLKRMSGPPIPASPLKSSPTSAQQSREPNPIPRARPEVAKSAQPPRNSPRSGPTQKQKTGIHMRGIWNTLTLIFSLVLLGGSGLVAWKVADPVAATPTWKLLGLPEIPGLTPPAKASK